MAVSAVVVAALAVVLVVLKNQDDRPHAEVGDVFGHPTATDPLPHRGEVLLPWARLQVGAGEPRQELPDLFGAQSNVQAPEDGSFVQVEASLADDYQVPMAALAAPYTQQIEVVLRADGRDYPLTGPGGLTLDPNGPLPQGGTRWVAVEGEPTDLEVRVTVDGLTQVVDASDGSVEAGRAADLADLRAPDALSNTKPVRCGTVRRLDRAAPHVEYPRTLSCKVTLALRTPYVDGIGWAKPGREFLVVHVVRPQIVDVATGSGSDLEFWDARVRLTARLDGGTPVGGPVEVNSLTQGPLTISDPDNPEQVVFDVPQGPVGDLTLGLDVRARRGAPFVTERQRLRFRWTVPGRRLA